MSINFIDLKSQQDRIKDDIDQRLAEVLAHGQYILGPEVRELESVLADTADAGFCVSCASGTDALILPMMGWDIGPGDAVFCPSFTFAATAETIALVGATPVFVDIDRDTYNLDPASLERAIKQILASGELKPRAIIAVDLFGQSADYPAINKIAKAYDLKLISDSAQGFGTRLNGLQPNHWADVVTTSFFPAKPLGCYGDGGAIITDDENLVDVMKSLRVHGQGVDKYDNIRIGINSRLDSMQAAILLSKLSIFSDELVARQKIADRYCDGLSAHVERTPKLMTGATSSWAQFTIEVKDPDGLSFKLRDQGVPTARYYPKPIHHQTAYRHFPVEGNGLGNTEDCIDKVISLPMHAYLDEETQDQIISAIIKSL